MAGKMLNTDWPSNCSVLPDLPNLEQQRIGGPNESKQFPDTEGIRNCVFRTQNVSNSDGPSGKQLVPNTKEVPEKQQRTWDAYNLPKDVVELVLDHETDCLDKGERRYITDDMFIDLGKGELSHHGDRKQDTSNQKTFSKASAFKTFSEFENVTKAYEGVMFPPRFQIAVEEPAQEDVSLRTSATVSLSRNNAVAIEPTVESNGFNSVPRSFAVEDKPDLTAEQLSGTCETPNEVLNISSLGPVMAKGNPSETQSSSFGPGVSNGSVTCTRPLEGDNSDARLNALLLSITYQENTENVPAKLPDPNNLQVLESSFQTAGNSPSSQFIGNHLSKTHVNHIAKTRNKPRCRKLNVEDYLFQTETDPMHETKVNPSFHAAKNPMYQARGNFESQTVRKHLKTPVRHPTFQNVGDILFQVRGKHKQNTSVSYPSEAAVFSQYQAAAGQRFSQSTNKFAEYAVEDPLSQTADKLMSETTGYSTVYKAETPQFQAASELETQKIRNLSSQTAGYNWPQDVRNPLLQITSELLPETAGNPTFQTAECPVPQKTEDHLSQMEVDPPSPAQHKKSQNMQLQTTEYFHFQTVLTPHSQTHCNLSTVPGSPMSVCSDVSMSSSKSRFPSTTLWPDQPDKPPCSENVKQALVTKIQKNRNGQRYQPYPEPESGHQSFLPNLYTFRGLFLQ